MFLKTLQFIWDPNFFYPDPVVPLVDTHGSFLNDTTENRETEMKRKEKHR